MTLSREKKKNQVITGDISTMELELEESECFNFFLDSAYISIAYDPMKTKLLMSEAVG